MRRLELTAVVLLALIGAEAKAQTTTGVTIDDVQVVNLGMGQYKITATGKMSLALGDTLVNYRFFFTDPNGMERAPIFQPPFNPPQPGSSSNYTCLVQGGPPGGWKFTAQMSWTTPDKVEHTSSVSKPFNAGP